MAAREKTAAFCRLSFRIGKPPIGGLASTAPVSLHEVIRKQCAIYGRLHERIHTTFLCRHRSGKAHTEWQVACRDFHFHPSPLAFAESPEGRERIRRGDPDAVEQAIAFLEVDPVVFRSGYAKEAVIRCLKSLKLDTRQTGRLQGVVLAMIVKEARSDFRAYRRLAARVHSPAFEQRLVELAASSDWGIRRRAAWVLGFVRRHPTIKDLPRPT